MITFFAVYTPYFIIISIIFFESSTLITAEYKMILSGLVRALIK